MRKGFITCVKCGSKVMTSQKAYGGILRVVCSNDQCMESEIKAFS